jgi:hypothetical protein
VKVCSQIHGGNPRIEAELGREGTALSRLRIKDQDGTEKRVRCHQGVLKRRPTVRKATRGSPNRKRGMG